MKLTKTFLSLLAVAAFLATSSLAFAGPKAIQTQFGPDGMEVDLIRAKVSGKVLSTVFSARISDGSADLTYAIEEVNYIDTIKSQSYQVLKDGEGKVIAGPIRYTRKDEPVTHIYVSEGKNVIFWYKFPAPPEDVTTIQINLPSVSPFDDVEIVR